jgi:hypothetical protein
MKLIFPEDRNIMHPDQSILTVYAGSEHFSFSVYDPDESGSYFYKELIAENQTDAFSAFKEAFFDNDFFSLPFRRVWIMHHTPLFAFIPNSIYKNETRKDFLDFLFSEQQEITLNRVVSSTGINVIYQIPEAIYNFFTRSFANPEFIHYSVPIIAYFSDKIQKAHFCRMTVNLQGRGLDIFCFSEKTFLMGNYFPCSNVPEALYYILFVWKQLQFNQLNDYLYVAGNSSFKEELITQLTPYLQNIYDLPVFPEIYFEGVETGKIPFELVTLASCEL